MPSQFIRAASLVVFGATGDGLDLSQFRFVFQTFQSDFETPNYAKIRVYNLADKTAQQIRQQYNGPQQLSRQNTGAVALQAGYRDGALGSVFQGQIKQVKVGRESPVDTFIEIMAADGDLAYNFGVVNTNVPAGTSMSSQAAIIASQMGVPVDQVNFSVGYQAPNIRGKVLYGMARTYLRGLARSGQAKWSIKDGKLVITPLGQAPSSEAFVVNSTTGMVGLPEQTNEGIKVTTLLNPTLVVGSQIQLNQASIQRATVSVTPGDENQFESAYPGFSSDGFYTAIVVEHEGDMRGNPWYTHVTALAVDKTSGSVQPYG